MKKFWLAVAVLAVVAGCNSEQKGKPTMSAAGTSGIPAPTPEWVVRKIDMTTNSYCAVVQTARVRESDSKFSLAESNVASSSRP